MRFNRRQTAKTYRKITSNNHNSSNFDIDDRNIISVYLRKIISPRHTRRNKVNITAYENSILQLGFSKKWLPHINSEKIRLVRCILEKAKADGNYIIISLAEKTLKKLQLTEIANKTRTEIVAELDPLISHDKIYFDSDIKKTRSIGQGTYGQVFRIAFGTGPESPDLAIKQANKSAKGDRSLKKEILRESIKILKLSPSPFVINCLGIYVGKKELGFIIPYMKGGSLSDYLKNNMVPHSIDLNLALGIGYGLQHLHYNNMVHADLNPRNILINITPHGINPVINDLGSSEFLDSTTGIFEGVDFKTTYGYAAIELILRARQIEEFTHAGTLAPYKMEHSKATDIYSYAGILYLLVTRDDPIAYQAQSDLQGDQSITLHDIHLNYNSYMDTNYSRIHASGTDANLYSIITGCWSFVIANRPTINAIVAYLEPLVFAKVEHALIYLPIDTPTPDSVKLPAEYTLSFEDASTAEDSHTNKQSSVGLSPGTLAGYDRAARHYVPIAAPAPIPVTQAIGPSDLFRRSPFYHPEMDAAPFPIDNNYTLRQ